VAAPDRESLIVRTRCLDRVLSWHQFIIPQFYSGKEMMAYWNRFARPAKTAKVFARRHRHLVGRRGQGPRPEARGEQVIIGPRASGPLMIMRRAWRPAVQ
jgi:hypothetical protein